MNDHQQALDGPDRGHRRPPGVDDRTVEALGALSKALETTERARGSLYAFHQLTGSADLELDRAVRLLHEAGHPEWAEKVRSEILGRNVIPGHWTFQIVEALGALSKALETTERARGRLYDFHQMTGTADLQLDRAVRLLEEAGHPEWAAKIRSEILGRNVIPGHWTFQIVEAYNATYYLPFHELETSAVRELAQGRDHLYEAEMKERRRTPGHPDHTASPPPPGG